MKYAIDLLWVKPGKVGGAESYIRNLLLGIAEIGITDEIYLVVTLDNKESFAHFLKYPCFKFLECNISSEPVSKRILWQNINFERILRKNGIVNCFCPFYCKPLKKSKEITYVTVIHDLQQLHYPEYFTKLRYHWIKFAWKRAILTSKRIIAISEFDKNDIMHWYHVQENKVKRIYNPIVVDNGEVPFEEIGVKYGIQPEKYFFALSSLLKHKNLDTLLRIIKEIKDGNIQGIPHKLIISGIGGAAKSEIEAYIKENHLENDCVLTGFISNEERNSLYINSFAFLFPSVFEGFGMPPVEGLILGTRVVTTKKTSIFEVSNGLAYYVDDPYDSKEWIRIFLEIKDKPKKKFTFPQYDKRDIAEQYLEELRIDFDER